MDKIKEKYKNIPEYFFLPKQHFNPQEHGQGEEKIKESIDSIIEELTDTCYDEFPKQQTLFRDIYTVYKKSQELIQKIIYEIKETQKIQKNPTKFLQHWIQEQIQVEIMIKILIKQEWQNRVQYWIQYYCINGKYIHVSQQIQCTLFQLCEEDLQHFKSLIDLQNILLSCKQFLQDIFVEELNIVLSLKHHTLREFDIGLSSSSLSSSSAIKNKPYIIEKNDKYTVYKIVLNYNEQWKTYTNTTEIKNSFTQYPVWDIPLVWPIYKEDNNTHTKISSILSKLKSLFSSYNSDNSNSETSDNDPQGIFTLLCSLKTKNVESESITDCEFKPQNECILRYQKTLPIEQVWEYIQYERENISFSYDSMTTVAAVTDPRKKKVKKDIKKEIQRYIVCCKILNSISYTINQIIDNSTIQPKRCIQDAMQHFLAIYSEWQEYQKPQKCEKDKKIVNNSMIIKQRYYIPLDKESNTLSINNIKLDPNGIQNQWYYISTLSNIVLKSYIYITKEQQNTHDTTLTEKQINTIIYNSFMAIQGELSSLANCLLRDTTGTIEVPVEAGTTTTTASTITNNDKNIIIQNNNDILQNHNNTSKISMSIQPPLTNSNPFIFRQDECGKRKNTQEENKETFDYLDSKINKNEEIIKRKNIEIIGNIYNTSQLFIPMCCVLYEQIELYNTVELKKDFYEIWENIRINVSEIFTYTETFIQTPRPHRFFFSLINSKNIHNNNTNNITRIQSYNKILKTIDNIKRYPQQNTIFTILEEYIIYIRTHLQTTIRHIILNINNSSYNKQDTINIINNFGYWSRSDIWDITDTLSIPVLYCIQDIWQLIDILIGESYLIPLVETWIHRCIQDILTRLWILLRDEINDSRSINTSNITTNDATIKIPWTITQAMNSTNINQLTNDLWFNTMRGIVCKNELTYVQYLQKIFALSSFVKEQIYFIDSKSDITDITVFSLRTDDTMSIKNIKQIGITKIVILAISIDWFQLRQYNRRNILKYIIFIESEYVIQKSPFIIDNNNTNKIKLNQLLQPLSCIKDTIASIDSIFLQDYYIKKFTPPLLSIYCDQLSTTITNNWYNIRYICCNDALQNVCHPCYLLLRFDLYTRIFLHMNFLCTIPLYLNYEIVNTTQYNNQQYYRYIKILSTEIQIFYQQIQPYIYPYHIHFIFGGIMFFICIISIIYLLNNQNTQVNFNGISYSIQFIKIILNTCYTIHPDPIPLSSYIKYTKSLLIAIFNCKTYDDIKKLHYFHPYLPLSVLRRSLRFQYSSHGTT